MSQTISKSVTLLGYTFAIPCPASAELWDAVAGPGECLQAAFTNEAYRGYAGPHRAEVLKQLEAAYGEANKGETPDKYVKRHIAAGTFSQADVNRVSDAVIGSGKVNFEEVLRGSSRAAIGKDWLEGADGIIKKWADGQGNLDTTLAKIRQVLPSATLDPSLDGDELRNALARLLRDRATALAKTDDLA